MKMILMNIFIIYLLSGYNIIKLRVNSKNKIYMNLNQRKNSKNKNLETDNFKRRLSEPDSIFACIKNNYENQSLIKFVDLKFYLDKIHLENQLQSKGLNKYKEPLLDAMNSAAKILESFLKIYKGISPKLETDDDIKKFGILDWNKYLIGQNVDQ